MSLVVGTTINRLSAAINRLTSLLALCNHARVGELRYCNRVESTETKIGFGFANLS